MDLNSLGPAGAAVVIVIAFLRFMRESFGKLNDSIEKNTKVTTKMDKTMTETVRYLKHRNGSFEKLIKEQPQIHQLIKEHFEDDGTSKR